MVQAGWQHVPHLDDETKRELLENTPVHLRDARSQGTPSLGSGAIYPIEQSAFVVEPFAIPAHWAKGYGFDVGWNRTAAIFGAWDRDSDVLYLYTEHYQGQREPASHATAIRARGDWLIGAIDPASRASGQKDGEQLFVNYRELGLHLMKADNSREAGIHAVQQMLFSGRLKVFSTCQNWLAEHRLYRRDERGHIVKDFDHLMDATRYLVLSRTNIMRTKPVTQRPAEGFVVADSSTGY